MMPARTSAGGSRRPHWLKNTSNHKLFRLQSVAYRESTWQGALGIMGYMPLGFCREPARGRRCVVRRGRGVARVQPEASILPRSLVPAGWAELAERSGGREPCGFHG